MSREQDIPAGDVGPIRAWWTVQNKQLHHRIDELEIQLREAREDTHQLRRIVRDIQEELAKEREQGATVRTWLKEQHAIRNKEVEELKALIHERDTAFAKLDARVIELTARVANHETKEETE